MYTAVTIINLINIKGTIISVCCHLICMVKILKM